MNILYLLMTMLKLIGITLLIILLVLLITIIAILLVPIKYYVYIHKQDTMYASTEIKWLYSIIALEIIYNEDQSITKLVKLFGKRVFPFKIKKTTKTKNIKKTKQQNKVEKEVKIIRHNKIPIMQKTQSTEKVQETQKTKKQIKKETKKQKKIKRQRKTKKNKISFKKISNQILDFQYKKELLSDTIGWIRDILKEIKPSKLSANLEIGRDDPAATGSLMGMLATLYPFYYANINIIGNYEKECLYGTLKASGDLTLGRFLYDFIKYIRKTSVKQMIKFIWRDRKENKHGRKTTN